MAKASVIIVSKPLDECEKVLEALSNQELGGKMVMFVCDGMPISDLSPMPRAKCVLSTTRPFKCSVNENKVEIEGREPVVWTACLQLTQPDRLYSENVYRFTREIFRYSRRIATATVHENDRFVEPEEGEAGDTDSS